MKRRIALSLILTVLVLFQSACAPNINVLKGVVVGFAPLVAYEISQGKISPAKAVLYTKDANDLVDGFTVLSVDWKAAQNGADRATAIGKFANLSLRISTDFVKIPNLELAMVTLNTTITIIQAFYGEAPPAVGASALRIPRTEKELNEYIKTQSKLLQQQLQVRK